MANIKKNFNFRNGVQVDDDNLLVTATGLVGIGTTVPTESLDVRGNVKIIGNANITNATVGILTLTEVVPTQIIGAGVSIKSGIVTAQGSGIVTFYGDARYLQGMPTSQWEDTNAGFGVSSIYNTGGTVGIATTNPQSTLQVGNNVDGGESGVGISSAGNINASGIISATTFSGGFNGNIVSDTVVSGIATFSKDLDVDGHTFLDNVSVAGVTSFTGVTNHDAGATVDVHFDVIGLATFDDVFVSSGSTFAGTIDANGDLDVDGHTNLDNVSVAGITTFSDDVDFLGVPVGAAQTSIQFHKGDGTNSDLDNLRFYDSASASFGVGNTGGLTIRGNYNSTGASPTFNSFILASGDNFFIDGGASTSIKIRTQFAKNAIIANSDNGGSGTVELYHSSGGIGVPATKKLETSGIGVTIYNQLDTTNIVASGVITATTVLNSPLIGVGTDAPASDIQVRKSGDTEIQVTSDTGSAGITVGREAGSGKTNNAELRYGLVSGGAPYSSAQSLDLINYGTGNFNYHISANNPGAAVGDYHWHKGLNSGKLMTLTNTGRLGIGETQPNETLTVSGVCTISANSFVGGNFFVAGNTTVGGDVSIDGNLIIPSINTNITGNLTGSVFGNVNIFSGISTFKKVGVNTTVCFDSLDFDGINAIGAFKRLGIGQTQPDGILDVSGEDSNPVKKFILLPQVSAGSTSVIQAETPVGGGLIYNTTLRKLQFYNGTNWETVTSVEVTG